MSQRWHGWRTTRRLVAARYLWHPGDPANEVVVVHSGEVREFLVDADGAEVFHLRYGPGVTLGEPGYFSVERTWRSAPQS
jgi:CRP-like cAMP-binding protein